MLPWAHAAFGYLLYSFGSRIRTHRPPSGVPVLALVFGTQFPDLIDKPAAWTFGVLASGRSFAHSLFTFALVLGVLWSVFDDVRSRTLVTAFGVGYTSHLVGDVLGPVLHGNFGKVGFLLWPIFPGPSGHHTSFLQFFLTRRWSPMLALGVVLTAFTLAVWVWDGMPGVADVFFGKSPERDEVGYGNR
ncbi:metal-dependent hydrolase [Halopelagius longus]|uniref:LexA-binding, inner membrane-associated putative hydrolase n=1 Tax=Halopelagius longus TaxID=1236180 RepID=A0A1H1GK27_9EURY|nr:metal-dependent hydrolase [Halopelagius longus]RDI69690.1 metal-dependent hydrolase [Halopelagius longus]SDR13602.1 LexA-binding, inner membrane-associated putative hydrolase [Halopelagius longus]